MGISEFPLKKNIDSSYENFDDIIKLYNIIYDLIGQIIKIGKDRKKSNHLSNETIWEFEYVLVMSENHPLARKEDITIEDLKGYTKITHGDIELPHDKYSGKAKKNQNRNVIYVYERGSQFDLLSNVPDTYMWVSPIPEKVLKKN